MARDQTILSPSNVAGALTRAVGIVANEMKSIAVFEATPCRIHSFQNFRARCTAHAQVAVVRANLVQVGMLFNRQRHLKVRSSGVPAG